MRASRKKLFVFLLVLAFLAVLYSHRNEIFLNKNVSGSNNNIIYTMDSSLRRNFSVYGNALLINDNQEIIAVSKKGKTIWTVPCVTKNPILSISGAYILVADIGGNDMFVVKDGKLLSQITVDTEIFTAKINKNGCIAVSTAEDGYRCKISVFTSSGNNIYSWKISDSYALDCEVSPNNKNLAVTLLSFGDEKLISTVALASIAEERVLENSEFANCVFSRVTFNADGGFLAIADTAALYYDKNGRNIWNKNFDGRTLQSSTFTPSKNIALMFENTRNSSTLECYSTSGKLLNSTELPSEVRTLTQNNDSFLAAGSRDVTLFSARGKKTAQTSLNNEIRWAGVCSKNRHVFVVHGNSVECIKL